MNVVTDAACWADENFGRCDLGDKRRRARLVRVASDLARRAGSSLLQACDGDDAASEGLYRLLRNEAVAPAAIAADSVPLSTTFTQRDACRKM